jgi:hypothetical protein
MSKYRELVSNPVKNIITGKPKQVLLDLVSCMCDNKSQITFALNENGSYSCLTHGQAFSNFQTGCSKADLLWEADDEKWDNVLKMINTGTSQISQIRVRM